MAGVFFTHYYRHRVAGQDTPTPTAMAPAAHAQADLPGQLEQDDKKKDAPTQMVDATFKATRLINGHTVQTSGEGTMVFLISHRFGVLNSGAYNFFGLDAATLRLGFEYAITDRLEKWVLGAHRLTRLLMDF